MASNQLDRHYSSQSTLRTHSVWRDALGRSGGMYTNFLYSSLKGLGKEAGVTRRDPSTVLKIDGKYYVWYTRRSTKYKVRQELNIDADADLDWEIPRFDWDLSEIYYATSEDGFSWIEQGVSARRGPKDQFDGRSVFTPDILMSNGKYFLYYQAVDHPYGTRTRNVVGMSWSESPDGPWNRFPEPVLKPGRSGEWMGSDDTNHVNYYGAWDSHKVHDPFILCRDGKYWLYYKGQPMGWGSDYCSGIGWGVAIADSPYGPFEKYAGNPVTNSGHETCLFPWGAGILAICNHDGPEKDTIQYSEDGLNFEVVSHVNLPPCAPGPFCADSYSNTEDGRGITWGLSHIATEETKSGNSYIIRFDCNLSKDVQRQGFRTTNIRMPESTYFSPDFDYDTKNKYSYDLEQLNQHKKKICPCGFEQRNSDSRVCEECGDVIVFWSSDNSARDYPIVPDMAVKDANLSNAMKRVHSVYGYSKDKESPFYSGFKYRHVHGLGKEIGVTRRDPSKIIKYADRYYVWYTRRETDKSPLYGGQNQIQDADHNQQSWDQPLTDWDLAEIWCASSEDGVHWEELGMAIRRGDEQSYFGRSVCTPDIIAVDGSFYLFFQAIETPYLTRSRNSIGLAVSETPIGPWRIKQNPVLAPGKSGLWQGDGDDNIVIEPGVWDSHKVHDPYVLLWDNKYWLYYKGRPMGCNDSGHRYVGLGWGVAVSDKPEGPYIKSSYNPVTNSGHETFLYPLGKGVVAITSLEGPEMNTVQYSEDGINFAVVGKVSLPPVAAGPYIDYEHAQHKRGQGVEWGLAHINHDNNGRLDNSYLVRFDCNLGAKGNRKGFYRPWNFRYPESAYLNSSCSLSSNMRQEAIAIGQIYDRDTEDFAGNWDQ